MPHIAEARNMNFYVGTSGYSYPKWKGRFYPAKMPANEMLSFYASRFHAVEINSTFYTPPDASVLEGWTGQVPADFRFAFKTPRTITHFRRLKDVGELVTTLLDVLGTLKKRLGPLLVQLPPNFKKDMARLREFLPLLKSHRAAMEFRHSSWFDDEVFGLLRKHKTALCIADTEDDLEVPFVATADWGYLRLRRSNYNTAALKAWASRMKSQTWRDCFVFFKHEDEAKGPKMASRLLEVIGAS